MQLVVVLSNCGLIQGVVTPIAVKPKIWNVKRSKVHRKSEKVKGQAQ